MNETAQPGTDQVTTPTPTPETEVESVQPAPADTTTAAPLEAKDLTDLTADAILSAPDQRVIRHYQKHWKGYVYLRTLTAAERDAYESSLVSVQVENKRGKQSRNMEANTLNIRARLVVLCLCDRNGARLFKNSQADDLGKKGSEPLDELYEKCCELNGMTDTSVDDAEKN